MYESLSRSDNAPLELVPHVVHLLGSGPAGLITDVDGTISPVVARPGEARVLPRARSALRGLKDVLTVVGVVSGRGAADVKRMVDVDGLVYVGNHGLEIWNQARGEAEIVAEARPWVPRLASVLNDIKRKLELRELAGANGPLRGGILIENKGATASLHYRMAADPQRARRELLEILARCALTSGLRVEEGRMVINLLPPLMVTKGSAVSWLVREHRLERVVYLGDDVTDAHAFRALHVLHQNGEVEALSIGVVGEETPPSIRQLADASVPSVEAVADLLCRVFEQLRTQALMPTGEC